MLSGEIALKINHYHCYYYHREVKGYGQGHIFVEHRIAVLDRRFIKISQNLIIKNEIE